jgi:hypothetical protein
MYDTSMYAIFRGKFIQHLAQHQAMEMGGAQWYSEELFFCKQLM